VTELSDNAATQLENKIALLKINPYRYKKLQHPNLLLFRIRFTDKRKEKRLIYTIDKNNIKLLCILDRNKEYRDLERYINKN